MQALIAAAARHPVFANLLMMVLIITGLVGFLELRREIMPEINVDTVLITVEYPGASAGEIEEGVLNKIENALRGLNGLKTLKGSASEGVATVEAEISGKVADKRAVVDKLKAKVDAINTFPKDAEKPRMQEILSTSDAYMMVLHGNAPEKILRELGYDTKDELQALGMSKVELSGVRDYEIVIEVDKQTLEAYQLSLDEITRKVRDSSLNLPAGSLRTQHEEMKLEIRGRRYTADAYRQLVVLNRNDGTLLRLGQIATVRESFVEGGGLGRFDGKPAVLLNISRTGGEDTVEIARKAQEYMASKNPTLPPGVQLSTLADFSTEVNGRINLLMTNGWQGLILLFFALWLFLNLRLALWVAIGIPIAFAFTGIILWGGDYTLNMLTLFGLILALGIVVDDAIVIGENVHTHTLKGKSPMQAAIDGTSEMAWPVLAAVTTTIIAFAPMFVVTGVMGKFIAILPVAVVATLVGSLIEGLLILPAHLGHGGKEKPPSRIRQGINNSIQFLIERLYKPLYQITLRARYLTFSIITAVSLVSMTLLINGSVPIMLTSSSDTLFLEATVAFPEGTPRKVTEQAMAQLEQGINQVNEQYGKLGKNGVLATAIYSEAKSDNEGVATVVLVGPEERELPSPQILVRWRELSGKITGADRVSFVGLGGAGPPVADLQILAFGEDMEQLSLVDNELRAALARYAGVSDIESDLKTGKRELRIELKPQGRAMGITLQSLASQIRQGFFGDEALKVQRGRDEVNVQVRYPLSQRASLEDLYAVRVNTPQGRQVPFNEVAEVTLTRGISEFKHHNGKRRIQVEASVDKERISPKQVVNDLRANLVPQLAKQYPEITVSFEGAESESAESMGSLAMGFIFALVGIYCVLALVFRSYAQPLLIMTVIPFGIVGAILGHYFLGYAMTIWSLSGVVALSGVVVNGSLVLIDRINQGQREGETTWEAVTNAGPARFRAILLTTVTTVAGLLPLLAERSFQAQDLQPMALSLAAGLIFATVLTLFLIPCLYLMLNDLRRVSHWLWSGDWLSREQVEPAAAGDGHD